MSSAYRREIDVEDNQVMIVQLEGGIKASYSQCHFTPEYFRNTPSSAPRAASRIWMTPARSS